MPKIKSQPQEQKIKIKSYKSRFSFRPEFILILVILISGYNLIAPGYPTTGDVWPHLTRQKIVYCALKEGFSPFYSFYFYSGYPHLRFYSPLFFFITGFFSLLAGGNLVMVLKVFLFILHALSSLAIFHFLKYKTKEIYPSLFGTIVYLSSPWRLLYITSFGNYPLALIYLFLPLLFLYFEKVINEDKIVFSLLFGLFLALTFLSHIFYALFASLFLFILFLFNLRKFNIRLLKRLLLASASFFAIALFFLLPFIFEYRNYLYPQPPLNLPPPNPFVLLGLKSEVGGYTGTYLGLSIILFLILGVIAKVFDLNFLMLVLALLLTFLAPILEKGNSVVTAGLPPQRFLVYFIFFAAILAAKGFKFLAQKLNLTEKVLFYFLALLVILDTAPPLVRMRYAAKKDFLAVRDEIYSLLSFKKVTKVLDIDIPEDRIDNFRRLCRYPACGFIYGNLPTPLGPPYHQFAPRNMLYSYPFINLIAYDLSDTISYHLNKNSLKALALLGVSHIITLPTLLEAGEDETYVLLKEGVNWDDRFLKAQAEPPLTFGEVPSALILASNLKKPMRKERLIKAGTLFIAHDWQELLEEIEIDYENNRLNFIPVKEEDKYESLPGLPSLTMIDHKINHQSVFLKYQLKEESFLRLPFSYDPSLKIYLDGKEVSFFETKDHFIYLKSPPGTHTIEIKAPLPSLRRWTIFISLVGFILTIFLILVKKNE